MNPTIDLSFEVDRVLPTHKMRGRNERHDPGGGGINVARVFVRLGGNARCHYLSGGATGVALDGLLDLHQIVRSRVPIAGETRISASVFERSGEREYRFVTEGPTVAEDEWQACLESVSQARCRYFVASGSLPRGVPEDFYARVANTLNRNGPRFVLDSSGAGLAGGLAGGGVFLVKPSIGELRQLTGEALESDEAVAGAARAIVDRGEAEHVVVTMGREGAMLVNAGGILRLPAIPVDAVSCVGAGDSFVAGMVHALAGGSEIADAFRFGIAAGAAATLTPGTDLARAEDIAKVAGMVT
ncbi:MAG TPA: 1-phosphofructokinase family hexose kinase [Sphingomonadaceae bacterium]|nr:1-phosphofructokinase family hexose kinase [Sphingomonadaceae bacterium]